MCFPPNNRNWWSGGGEKARKKRWRQAANSGWCGRGQKSVADVLWKGNWQRFHQVSRKYAGGVKMPRNFWRSLMDLAGGHSFVFSRILIYIRGPSSISTKTNLLNCLSLAVGLWCRLLTSFQLTISSRIGSHNFVAWKRMEMNGEMSCSWASNQ